MERRAPFLASTKGEQQGSPFAESRFYRKLVRMIVCFSFMRWMHMVVGTVVSGVIMVMHVRFPGMGMLVGMLMLVFMGVGV